MKLCCHFPWNHFAIKNCTNCTLCTWVNDSLIIWWMSHWQSTRERTWVELTIYKAAANFQPRSWDPVAATTGCSIEEVFLKISQNSLENNCAVVSLLIKFQASLTARRVIWLCFWILLQIVFIYLRPVLFVSFFLFFFP